MYVHGHFSHLFLDLATLTPQNDFRFKNERRDTLVTLDTSCKAYTPLHPAMTKHLKMRAG